MKLKYYLRGLGIGIIVTTIILTVSFNSRIKKIEKSYKEPETTQESETLFPETTVAETTTQENTTTEPETTTQENTTAEPATTAKEETTAVPETTAEETEPVTEAPTNPPVKTYTLNITAGMFSEAVSATLKNQGIIDDDVKFNAFLANNGYASRICTGTFTVSADMSYEQIAKIITRQ